MTNTATQRGAPTDEAAFQSWLRTVCISRPPKDAEDLACCAWKEGARRAALASAAAPTGQPSDEQIDAVMPAEIRRTAEYHQARWRKFARDVLALASPVAPEAAPVEGVDGPMTEEYFTSLISEMLMECAGRPMDGLSEDDCHCFHRKELTPKAPAEPAYLDGIDAGRLIAALTWMGYATPGREELAARMSEYVNHITQAVMSHKEMFERKAEPAGAGPLTDAMQILRDLTQHASEVGDHTSESFKNGVMRLSTRAHKLLAAQARKDGK